MSSETTKANKCEDCGQSFDSENELHQHMNQEHVGNAWKPSFIFIFDFILKYYDH
jgi:hypothetical protein